MGSVNVTLLQINCWVCQWNKLENGQKFDRNLMTYFWTILYLLAIIQHCIWTCVCNTLVTFSSVAGVLLFYYFVRRISWWRPVFIGISVRSPCALMWIGLYCCSRQFVVSVRLSADSVCPSAVIRDDRFLRTEQVRCDTCVETWFVGCFQQMHFDDDCEQTCRFCSVRRKWIRRK